MAKARSGEWKVAYRIVDDLYPEPEAELSQEDLKCRQEFVSQVVREISTIRDDETIRCCDAFEMLAVDFALNNRWTIAFTVLKTAFELAGKEYPLEPEVYLRELYEARSKPKMVANGGPEIFLRR